MNKVALVTGGQRGIGFGISEALAGEGYKIALLAQCGSDDPEVADALGRLGPDASFFSHDLLNIDGHAAVVEQVENRLGPITTFVSNAGVPAKARGDMLDVEPDNFDFTLGVNLRGAFFLAQNVARRMLKQSSDSYRSMTFVTSVSAGMVSIERAEYCLSKAGASMMAKLFAARLAPHGIGVFEIRPGIIETAMTSAVKDKYTPQIEDGLVPSARWGQPSDIASAVVPIAEGRMAFATGSVINVDGGLSIPRL
ncbi:NAD(P)-dependent dehydrogenase (short-subunit alcohol dehydrogenase family) [Labrenzia sp. EL_208]|nr:NAD(P)-dependent dehydrogenase (short-subunit alcohol dehydrogenase family) [Labrenzia sp. EL_142]MBG6175957.1 NAD(P)-dependent dehydrogenase (short-subunit alcohol dehydrogenase family) [Labrenzia sp. EL_132]MBG6230282.1 NAD(P)-dependent dehydrogenase (short-subunit alcohol dehydrogenase family) [Labrenzia sp. EL_208]